MAQPKIIRKVWFQNGYPRSKEWTTMRPLHRLQKWTPSASFWLFPHPSTGKCIIWVSRVPFYRDIFMRRYTWRIPRDTFHILLWFANFRSLFMGWNKPLYHGMPRWMPFCFPKTFKGVSLIGMFIYRSMMVIYLLLFYMFMIYWITSSTVASILVIKNSLHDAFEMSDLGLLKEFLGLKIAQNFDGIMEN